MSRESFQDLRSRMVESQIAARGVKDPRVLAAMRSVPRHLFMDESLWPMAYDDMALSIGDGQTISQPYMVAMMTELLELGGTERVLEIGTGSGYQAAVLAELAREVYTVERIRSLSEKAGGRLEEIGCGNVRLRVGDGTLGWPEHAPFDRIIVTAGAPRMPEPLLLQLAEAGILVAPVGDRFSQEIERVRKRDGRITQEHHTPCVFVPLIGTYGWKPGAP